LLPLTCAAVGLYTAVAAADVAPEDVVIVDESEIPQALTDVAGDPVNGRAISINRKKGNCLACHQMPVPEQSFHGEVGPSLWGVGNIYSAAELRLRVVNYKALNEDVIMPAFYVNSDKLHRVIKKFQGKTILSAQEVEDVVAYLLTLTEDQPE
jgi:sulfur-oxidizing protein SoxX